MPGKIKDLEIRIDKQLRDLLAQAYTALRHASGRYNEGEPILTENAIRRDCYRAYRAIERAGGVEVLEK